MKNIAVFASGTGTNAENLGKYFLKRDAGKVRVVITDRKHAGVIEKMRALHIPVVYLTGDEFANGRVLDLLREYEIDLVVLAGFLKLVPGYLVREFAGRMINIHPALLPGYGGKGMFGMHVHQAVIKAKEVKTGITIHFVNEKFDEGEIIKQFEFKISASDTPETVASKIHELEMKHFPVVVEEVLASL